MISQICLPTAWPEDCLVILTWGFISIYTVVDFSIKFCLFDTSIDFWLLDFMTFTRIFVDLRIGLLANWLDFCHFDLRIDFCHFDLMIDFSHLDLRTRTTVYMLVVVQNSWYSLFVALWGIYGCKQLYHKPYYKHYIASSVLFFNFYFCFECFSLLILHRHRDSFDTRCRAWVTIYNLRLIIEFSGLSIMYLYKEGSL